MANILIVDADPDEGQLIAFTLRFAGHRVVYVPDFSQADAHLQQAAPRLVIVDAHLPSPATWLDHVSLPAILLVDQAPEPGSLAQSSSPDRAYFVRPVSPDYLTRLVDHLLSITAKRVRGKG